MILCSEKIDWKKNRHKRSRRSVGLWPPNGKPLLDKFGLNFDVASSFPMRWALTDGNLPQAPAALNLLLRCIAWIFSMSVRKVISPSGRAWAQVF
jgi:hypothetical protein